jgi:lipid-binding SYLF domain-containing protein
LLAGVDLSGGVLRPDKDADARAYGPGVMPRDVVDGGKGLLSPAAARPFLEALATESNRPAANN